MADNASRQGQGGEAATETVGAPSPLVPPTATLDMVSVVSDQEEESDSAASDASPATGNDDQKKLPATREAWDQHLEEEEVTIAPLDDHLLHLEPEGSDVVLSVSQLLLARLTINTAFLQAPEKALAFHAVSTTGAEVCGRVSAVSLSHVELRPEDSSTAPLVINWSDVGESYTCVTLAKATEDTTARDAAWVADQNTKDDEGDAKPREERKQQGCFEDLGDIYPPAQELICTVPDVTVNGDPLLRIPGLTWLFERHRGIFLLGWLCCLGVYNALDRWFNAMYERDESLSDTTFFAVFWTINVLLFWLPVATFICMYQRGVMKLALQSFDFWYLFFRMNVFFVAFSKSAFLREAPIWIYLAWGVPQAILSSLFLSVDGLPDHRIRVGILIFSVGMISGLSAWAFVGPGGHHKNDPIQIWGAYQTTWGAVGSSSALVAIGFTLKGFGRAVLGRDFVYIHGLERVAVKQRREAREAADLLVPPTATLNVVNVVSDQESDSAASDASPATGNDDQKKLPATPDQ